MEKLADRGRVLFADDDDAAREAIGAMLRRLGFECTCAANAAEALASLRAGSFEALLYDIQMPGNTSLELVEATARIAPGIPVILLTGRPSVETAARSVRLPVHAYLTKPPDTEELVRTLDQAVACFRDFQVVQAGRQRLREWEKDLQRIERLMDRPTGPDGGIEDFVRVSLRHAILVLADLEKTTQALGQRDAGRLREVDHLAALRRTVEVLARTRQNFKSKELADLRRQLEQLLERDDARPA